MSGDLGGMTGAMRRSWLLAMVLLMVLHHQPNSGGFSVPGGARKPLPAARSSPPDWVGQAAEAFSDPSVQRVWATVIERAGGLQKLADFFFTFSKAGKAWLEWKKNPAYDGTGDIDEHVSKLMGAVQENLKAGNNILIANALNDELPEKPIRGTYVEQLLVAVLCNNASGMSAVYAEPGTGKSVCVILAVTEVARTQKNDMFVVLQGNLNQKLRSFFRILDEDLIADIAPPFFIALRKKNIQLHLVFDNVLDGGVQDDFAKDRLKVLAGGASKHQHQVMLTMQDAEAAESVGNLNGDTTRIPPEQNRSYGAYRWSETETKELIYSLGGGRLDTEQILRESAIPDEIGRWRPRARVQTLKFVAMRTD